MWRKTGTCTLPPAPLGEPAPLVAPVGPAPLPPRPPPLTPRRGLGLLGDGGVREQSGAPGGQCEGSKIVKDITKEQDRKSFTF